jgi:hypothetical protein
VVSHEQLPLVVSHTPFEHEAQDAPPVPHWELDSDEYATHVLPLQHPFGHELALQTHSPVDVLHCWPVPQPEQLAPAVPHEGFVSEAHASHTPLDVQQPCGHEVASQTHCPAALHSCPDGQAPHVAPPAPHELLDSLASASHAPPLQQPAQDAPPHAHCPTAHASPDEHAPQAAPALPHSFDDWDA